MIRKKKKMAKNTSCNNNTLKHQLSMQRYEPSATAHMVRKLIMAVVAFGTTIPNRPSIITLFGCFRCLDFQKNDLLLYIKIVITKTRRLNVDVANLTLKHTSACCRIHSKRMITA
jgi:hypothetical protein